MAKAEKITNPELFDIVRAPIVTEKSTAAAELGKYVFEVAVDATKPQIAEAVSKIFAVEVTKVSTINYDGKVKRFRGKLGKRNAFKKAIVTIKEGQAIDFSAAI